MRLTGNVLLLLATVSLDLATFQTPSKDFRKEPGNKSSNFLAKQEVLSFGESRLLLDESVNLLSAVAQLHPVIVKEHHIK